MKQPAGEQAIQLIPVGTLRLPGEESTNRRFGRGLERKIAIGMKIEKDQAPARLAKADTWAQGETFVHGGDGVARGRKAARLPVNRR